MKNPPKTQDRLPYKGKMGSISFLLGLLKQMVICQHAGILASEVMTFDSKRGRCAGVPEIRGTLWES